MIIPLLEHLTRRQTDAGGSAQALMPHTDAPEPRRQPRPKTGRQAVRAVII
jgi:hypothetical protein